MKLNFRSYNNLARISFDPVKDRSNVQKHGVSLSLAAAIDWSSARTIPDTRRDYGEIREIGYAIIENRLYCVVYTQRQDRRHVISLRKANAREVRNYVEHTQTPAANA